MDAELWEEISKGLTDNTLKDLQENISRLLAEEDKPGAVKEFEVREHLDFKQQADIFENELKKRDIDYKPIQW